MEKTIFISLCISLTGLLLYACINRITPEEKSGEIVMEIASRGSYQYLVKIGNNLYWPENLPERFKVPELKIGVRYIKTGTFKDIYKPAPNDVPVKSYTVPVITILEISEIG